MNNRDEGGKFRLRTDGAKCSLRALISILDALLRNKGKKPRGVVNFFTFLRALKRTLFSLFQEANYQVAVTRSGNEVIFARHSIRLWTAHYEKKKKKKKKKLDTMWRSHYGVVWNVKSIPV